MIRVALAVCCFGCGRLGFDELGGGGGPVDAANACSWGPFATPQPLPAIVQSPRDDWGAAPTLGGAEVWFYSYRNASIGMGDIFKAAANPYGAPVVVAELNTPNDERNPTLTDDALEIVFARADLAGAHLWWSSRASASSTFSAPALLSAANSSASDSGPFLSADGLRLVFMSSRSGMSLIYETTRADRTVAFAMPVSHPELGVAYDPTMSPDALDVYFSAGANGNRDIYTAHRPSTSQPFSAPARVPELSSPLDDLDARLSRDGATMFLDYDALATGTGNADLSSATRSCL